MDYTELIRYIQAIPELAESNPVEAAKRLDMLASWCQEAAHMLRSRADNSAADRGGIADHVQIQVYGPGGQLKQQFSTGVSAP